MKLDQALEIKNLVKHYGNRRGVVAVDDTSVTVEPGSMLVLLGPSGCGKTTLLRCVAGLEDPQRGSISLGGRPVFDGQRGLNVPSHRRDIGMVFQNYSLWPHMSVARNVDYPLAARGWPVDARDGRVAEILKIVQCDHLADRLPSMLSGGQQQRIALARALASRPAVMLLDEPLSNLDALLRDQLRTELKIIHEELKFTGIYVTHDQTEAFALGSRVAVMNAGRIEQIGDPQSVYEKPATEYVARFLGIRNCLEVDVGNGSSGAAEPLVGDMRLLGETIGEAKLYIRPSSLKLSRKRPGGTSDHIGIKALVRSAVYGGPSISYLLECRARPDLHAEVSSSHPRFAEGDEVFASASHDQVLIYVGDALKTLGAT